MECVSLHAESSSIFFVVLYFIKRKVRYCKFCDDNFAVVSSRKSVVTFTGGKESDISLIQFKVL
jgi:hypothetical protein